MSKQFTVMIIIYNKQAKSRFDKQVMATYKARQNTDKKFTKREGEKQSLTMKLKTFFVELSLTVTPLLTTSSSFRCMQP